MRIILDKIDFSIILRKKQELMGFAIIWIFLLHSQFAQNVPIIKEIVGFGAHGVDIFFFLSALGLSYSLNKNLNIKEFFLRRFWRIIPTYFIFLVGVHLLGIVLGFSHPSNLSQFFCWYSTFGWWINGLFTNQYCYFYEWYIPTLLVFYAFAPLLFKSSTKKLVFLTVISMLASLFFSYIGILSSIYWSFQRVAIYISGFIIYRIIIREQTKEVKTKLLLSFVLGVFIIAATIYFNVERNIFLFSIYRCALVFSMPVFLWLMVILTSTIPYLHNLLRASGVISLEIYLLHIYNRPLHYVRKYILSNNYLSILITFVIVFIIAYTINYLVNHFISPHFIKNKH